LVFIETSVFTKLVYRYLSEDEYVGLQGFLLNQPEAGGGARVGRSDTARPHPHRLGEEPARCPTRCAAHRPHSIRCPGFDPNSREGVPELKRPAPAGQTVSSWLAGQLQPDLEAEKQFYLERVIPAFMEHGLHAPTEDSPSGCLSERVALSLLGPLFYPTLRPPEDMVSDHATVMKWLQALTIAAGALTEQLTQSLTTGVPPVTNDSASRFDDEHSDH